MKTVFLVNPASANGSTGRRWPEIARAAAAAGITGDALFSQRPGELTDLTRRAIQDGATLLVVVGGDGTVHEVVNGAIGAGDVELAVLPRGTGKDFVRSLRIPSDVRAALAVARDGRPRTLDAGRATYRSWNGSEASAYFANFAGAGISGAIARRANRSSKALGGRVSFFAATLAVFASWKSADVTVQIDGERRSGDMFEVLVMNGDYAAGGMWVTPEAEPDDGRLDVLLIGDVSKADFVRTFPKIYRGKHLSHPKIDVLHGAAVRVDAAPAVPVVLDGEQPGTTPARFELVPQALRVRVP
ncbi:MAG: diacylglycerol kinase family lipid kinase [Actinobacteria bacterium]|nr:MAG: diacylglycerol kinase family lipid kinase [Actinomycetota bacterium]